jgi:hypothetical protein
LGVFVERNERVLVRELRDHLVHEPGDVGRVTSGRCEKGFLTNE